MNTLPSMDSATMQSSVNETSMSLVIPDELLKISGLSEEELWQEIVILLFQQDKISIGKASKLVGMNQLKFQKLLANRGICIHYDVAEFEEDLQHLREKGWL
ncbi:UPF0175 family protein [Nostoc sp.]|uniref:UPF0175 family protein n=2 Tax=Nostoc TaxID=1177 RepID=UPI002FFA7869